MTERAEGEINKRRILQKKILEYFIGVRRAGGEREIFQKYPNKQYFVVQFYRD